MLSNKTTLILLLIISVSVFAFSENNSNPRSIEDIKKISDSQNLYMPKEKVYLHFDKPIYKPGETIWFKAYLTNTIDNKPSTISDILYIDIITPNGNVEKNLKLKILNNCFTGSYEIGENNTGGIYKIRAYTAWMKNFDENTFFNKDLIIQKIVSSKLLFTIDFEKRAYGKNDTVRAKLHIETPDKKPFANEEITCTSYLNGNIYKENKFITDNQGNTVAIVVLPEILTTNDGLINISGTIDHSKESVSRSIPIVLGKIDLAFFPEGGDMVADVEGKIGFKALNEFGKAADIEGKILDNNNNEIATFKSFHMGMGAFHLTPKGSTSYKAIITKPENNIDTFKLPMAKYNAYALSVKNENDNQLHISIYSPSNDNVSLVIQIRGKIYYTENKDVTKGLNEIKVDVSNFPIGIAQITLFDSKMQEQCERLAFINNNKKLKVNIKTNKELYKPREKVQMTITTTDENNVPIAAGLSLSVVDDKIITLADDRQDNILSYMLLSSDVKGKIEEPNYYFKDDEPKANQALDFLLLTQGWRRFSLKEIHPTEKISFTPEKIGSIKGRIVKTYPYKPVSATVYLLEVGKEHRIEKVKTTNDGRFIFFNVDPALPHNLIVKKHFCKNGSLMIELENEKKIDFKINQNTDNESNNPIPGKLKEKANNTLDNQPVNIQPSDPGLIGNGTTGLDEVVVVGYGVQRKSDVTGSIVSVFQNNLQPIVSISEAINGRAAGIRITNNNGNPGSNANISIRGISSVVRGVDPLIVIDGVPVSTIQGQTNPLNQINASDIESIDILKDIQASSIFGSLGANGVIVITTKNGNYNGYWNGNYSNIPASKYIQPQHFSVTREFYQPNYNTNIDSIIRQDFRQTIYWNPNIYTNKQGSATIEFFNSDQVTTFRSTIEGFGYNGLVGRKEHRYASNLPFNLEAKFPSYTTFDDTINLMLVLKNNTNQTINGSVKILLPELLQTIGRIDTIATINPNSTKITTISLTTKYIQGVDKLKILFKSELYSDAFEQQIEVLPKGYPIEISASGISKSNAFTLNITDPISNSIKANFTAYPNILSDISASMKSIIRQPHGCFEQVSASTYPNIVALKFLKSMNLSDPNTEALAMNYIKEGYNKLVAFETKDGGFEWFGHTPPHEGLTAFGLLEFYEMKEVYNGVDEKMFERTKKWLLSRKAGDGTFKTDYGKYHFAGSPNEVSNAYIVYAFSEIGESSIIEEYNKAFDECVKSKDPYRMALLANASFNIGKNENGNLLIENLAKQSKSKNFDEFKKGTSITHSTGQSLEIETTSLYLLALLKSDFRNESEIQKCVKYMSSYKSFGGYGSTQSTVLAIKALTEYTKYYQKNSKPGTVELSWNKKIIAKMEVDRSKKDLITVDSLDKFVKKGKNLINVDFSDSLTVVPFSIDITYRTLTPPSDINCQSQINTTIENSNIKVGDNVRMVINTINKTNSTLPMTLAIVGIPSGLSVQPWQLREFKDKKVCDYIEIRKNYIVFYYTTISPKAIKTINLDLKADIAGNYQAPASCTYLYYTKESKYWINGTQVKIEP